MAGPSRLRSGIEDLDQLLTGLIPGDNVVWVAPEGGAIAAIEQALLREAGGVGLSCTYVTTSVPPATLRDRLGPHVSVLDARARGDHRDPGVLEHAVVQRAKASPPACVVVEDLHGLARRWDRDRALAFFSRVCPMLFDLGAVAYWRAPRRELGGAFLEKITKVTQCVLEVGGDHLRVIKAEGRPAAVHGQLLQLTVDGDTVRLRNERALGRLAQGLQRLRRERNLSQGELARLAGVTASAISQAEAGRRGLSLDTLVGLSERLGTTLDDLLASVPSAGYALARRDRAGGTAPCTPLLDDPRAGLRAYLVRLGPSDHGSPPMAHKGTEMLLVSSGLVQVHVGAETPVVRAGDAILATDVA
ncbi:MAG TPA: XRE family transcriptional regulator, partial [Acidimicrobiales bacterium]|nr:XRE family transcriptional regulator [Acidimicrobiales bacterium]